MDSNISNKERIELFQSSVSKMTGEYQVSSVRELLRQRYLKTKEEEEERKRKMDAEMQEDEEVKSTKSETKTKIGKQLARIFRFNNHRRVGTAPGRNNPQQDFDPLRDDPNVLFENFAFNGDDADVDLIDDDDDEFDDSIISSLKSFIQRLSWLKIAIFITLLSLYVYGQIITNRYGFGAVFFAICLLVFICCNLRRKAPGEWSAYSVFNPNCANIPSVSADNEPRILLGFNNLF